MPIRARLTLLMVLGAATLVAAGGLAFAVSLEGGARATLQQVLQDRARRVEAALSVGQLGVGGTAATVPHVDQTVVQVLAASGSVRYATQMAGDASLLSADQLALAEASPIWLNVRRPSWVSPRLVLAERDGAAKSVVLVGTSLDQLDDMMRRVVLGLAVGGPVVLTLTAVAAWLLTGGALAPVERLRAQAAEISAVDLSQRLRIPSTRDEVSALAQTLNHLLADLDAAMRRQRHFVAAAGHELRTPLARIRAELELALRPGRGAAAIRAEANGALSEVEQLSRVIEELLLLARGADRRLQLRRSVVALGPLVAAQLASQRVRAQQAEVLLVLDLRPGVRASVDEHWFAHALGNLLDNAMRHTPARKSIEVVVRQEDGKPLVEVRDGGPGFPEALLSGDFAAMPWPRVGSTSGPVDQRGAGLGLWIVWTIMEAHGGELVLANLNGAGASVRMILPSPAGSRGNLEPDLWQSPGALRT